MKKILVLMLSLFTIALISACGTDPVDDNDDDGYHELHTDRTDALTLNRDYAGKSFLQDGIGVVELHMCIDGDTTHFREGNTTFSVRYLGVDTPESTAAIEPWGKAASDFVCDVLTNADEIVLEWDEAAGNRVDTTGNRYLAFIWYDGRLLNLELVELAYSPSSAAHLKYGDQMQNAWYEVMQSGRRIYGEEDPNYDYALDGAEVDLDYLVENRTQYIGRFVTVEGTITRLQNDNFYLEQNGVEVYVYVGFNYVGPHIQVGNVIRMENVVPTYFPTDSTSLSNFQLSNFDRRRVTLISSPETEE